MVQDISTNLASTSGSKDQSDMESDSEIRKLVSELNARLKIKGVRGRITIVKNNFYLRGTYATRTEKKKERKVSLRLPADLRSLITVENRVVQLWDSILANGFLPDVYPWDVPDIQIAQRTRTFEEAIAVLKASFWKGKKDTNLQSQRTWARIDSVLKKLPQKADLNINVLLDWISSETEPETNSRIKACQYLKRLAVSNNLGGEEAIDELVGSYEPKQRKAIEDALLIQLIDSVREDDERRRKLQVRFDGYKDKHGRSKEHFPYGWLTAAQYVYGTRPAETFSLIPKKNGTAYAINLPKGRKKHEKFPLALPQEFVERWNLLEVERPYTFGLDNYDPTITKYHCGHWLNYLKRKAQKLGIENFQLLDLRHAWGIRSIYSELDPRQSCKSLGHDISTHYKTYNSTYEQLDADKAAALLNK